MPKKKSEFHGMEHTNQMDDFQSDSEESDSMDEYPPLNLQSDDEQEEVLPIADDDDDDDEEENYEEENNIDAWGKRKSTFYNADFVDKDRGRSYREEDAENAKAEEMDALEIQRRFLDDVHSTAFETKMFTSIGSICEENATIAKTDWNVVKKTAKAEVMSKQSPEFPSMLKDFKEALLELKAMNPKEYANGSTESNGLKLKRVKYQLMLHYTMNLSFYMVLKSKNNSSLQPPVLAKIQTYKKLLNDLNQVLSKQKAELPNGTALKKKEKKKVKFACDLEDMPKESTDKDKLEVQPSIESNASEDLSMYEKRMVNYQIIKNKGLLPKRKKEYRNPRVRHRMKFKKALVKRKGQVRTARTETQRYGGEASGIHANVTKSIKFK